jgi:sec-independent protein translocase protein TatA
MFGINSWEVMIFALIVLLLFGGSRIPTLARSLGKSITEFKKGVQGIEEDNSAPGNQETKNQETKSGSKSES